MAENADRLQLEFNAGDPASVAIALKRISEHFNARITKLEMDLACHRLAENSMLLLEEDAHEFKLLTRFFSRRQIYEMVNGFVRAQVDGGSLEELDKGFLVRGMATHIRLATVDGEPINNE